jgi:hypothetical protein
MSAIPTETPGESPTVAAIYAAYEAEHQHYDSLGISVGEIGTECDRALWYTFRWCSEPEEFKGRQLRLFDTGNKEETRLVEDLQRIGVECTASKTAFVWLARHVRGKCDGKGMGLPEAPKTEHLMEFKSTTKKAFTETRPASRLARASVLASRCTTASARLGMH